MGDIYEENNLIVKTHKNTEQARPEFKPYVKAQVKKEILSEDKREPAPIEYKRKDQLVEEKAKQEREELLRKQPRPEKQSGTNWWGSAKKNKYGL